MGGSSSVYSKRSTEELGNLRAACPHATLNVKTLKPLIWLQATDSWQQAAASHQIENHVHRRIGLQENRKVVRLMQVSVLEMTMTMTFISKKGKAYINNFMAQIKKL